MNGEDSFKASKDWVSLTEDDRVLLERGKAEHRDTTAATRRARAVAEQTTELAQSTLLEAHRQGEQLSKAAHNVSVIHEDVREASALLRFMRRCCCCQLSDCCDPTVDLDRRRRARVDERRANSEHVQRNIEMHTDAQQQAVAKLAKRDDPAYGGSEDAARSELLTASERLRAARGGPAGPKATDIGHGLPDADRKELQRETDEQDENLDAINASVSALAVMSRELHEELTQQGPVIGRLQDKVTVAHDNLGGLAREARRI